MGRKKLSRNRFVSVGAAAEDLRSRLAERSEVTDVRPQPGAEDLVCLEVTGDSAPRDTWQKLQESLGADIFVAPVLLDDEGAEMYPTGTLQVRFRQEPGDDEIERFAKAHGLRSKGRNRFARSLVSFVMERPGTSYLPDLTAELEADSEVLAAWGDTKAHFRRI